MPPGEDTSPAPTDGTHRTDGTAVIRPMVWMLWIRDAAAVVMYTALLIVAVDLPFTAPASRQKFGFLGLLLLGCVVVALPGALVALGHPVAAVMLRTQERRFKHPRLFGLTQVWASLLVSGWLGAMVLLFPYPLVPITYVPVLVGFGPMFAFVMFDRRR